MKFFISHNSPTTLTGKYEGASYFFPPKEQTEVPSKECGNAIMEDFNNLLGEYRMKMVVTDEEDENFLAKMTEEEVEEEGFTEKEEFPKRGRKK